MLRKIYDKSKVCHFNPRGYFHGETPLRFAFVKVFVEVVWKFVDYPNKESRLSLMSQILKHYFKILTLKSAWNKRLP